MQIFERPPYTNNLPKHTSDVALVKRRYLDKGVYGCEFPKLGLPIIRVIIGHGEANDPTKAYHLFPNYTCPAGKTPPKL